MCPIDFSFQLASPVAVRIALKALDTQGLCFWCLGEITIHRFDSCMISCHQLTTRILAACSFYKPVSHLLPQHKASLSRKPFHCQAKGLFMFPSLLGFGSSCIRNGVWGVNCCVVSSVKTAQGAETASFHPLRHKSRETSKWIHSMSLSCLLFMKSARKYLGVCKWRTANASAVSLPFHKEVSLLWKALMRKPLSLVKVSILVTPWSNFVSSKSACSYKANHVCFEGLTLVWQETANPNLPYISIKASPYISSPN